jgi:hypothetical protein
MESRKEEMARLAAKMRKSGDVQKAVEGKPMAQDPKGLYAGKKKKPRKVRFDPKGVRVKPKNLANKTAAERAREAMNKKRSRKLGEKK